MVKVRIHLLPVVCAAIASAAFCASTARAEGVYWRVLDESGPAGFLLGTVHSEDPRVLDFTESFTNDLGACETFAMEMVPDLPTLQRLLETMRLDGDRTLEALIGKARYTAVKQAMAGYGVPPSQLNTMKPWAAMMTLSLPPPRTGLVLDFNLSLRAAGAGLEVVGLETLEQQLYFLESLALPAQIELLDQALADHDRVGAVHDLMVDRYLEGNLESLAAVAFEQMDELTPETRDWFLSQGIVDRNRRMADRAVSLLEQGCTFIAVGALHLPGAEGLLDLLENAGYELSPLPSPFLSGGEGTPH